MGKEEDWKELNQWQEQQDQKQREDLDRRRYPSQGLKEQQKAEGKPDFITRLAKGFHFSEDVRDVLINYKDEIKLSIVVVFICIVMIFWNLSTVRDFDRALKKKYGNDFKRIAVVELEDKSKLYTYQSKKYPDLQIYCSEDRYKKGWSDVEQRRLQYFFGKVDCSLKDKFTVEAREENGILKTYRIAYIFDGLEEVEEAVETVYEVREILKKDMQESELGENTKVYAKSKSDVYLTLFYNPRFTLEEEKEDAKKQYVTGLLENRKRKIKEGKQITEEEKKEKFTPEILEKYVQTNLDIYLNGKPVIDTSYWRQDILKAEYGEKGYRFHLTQDFLEKVPGVTIQQTGDSYLTFYFDGKKYTNDHWYEEKDIRDAFGATFVYDYENLEVNVIIK